MHRCFSAAFCLRVGTTGLQKPASAAPPAAKSIQRISQPHLPRLAAAAFPLCPAARHNTLLNKSGQGLISVAAPCPTTYLLRPCTAFPRARSSAYNKTLPAPAASTTLSRPFSRTESRVLCAFRLPTVVFATYPCLLCAFRLSAAAFDTNPRVLCAFRLSGAAFDTNPCVLCAFHLSAAAFATEPPLFVRFSLVRSCFCHKIQLFVRFSPVRSCFCHKSPCFCALCR